MVAIDQYKVDKIAKTKTSKLVHTKLVCSTASAAYSKNCRHDTIFKTSKSYLYHTRSLVLSYGLLFHCIGCVIRFLLFILSCFAHHDHDQWIGMSMIPRILANQRHYQSGKYSKTRWNRKEKVQCLLRESESEEIILLRIEAIKQVWRLLQPAWPLLVPLINSLFITPLNWPCTLY